MCSTEPERLGTITRRQLLTMAGGGLVLSIAPFALHRRVLVRRSVPVMGTVANVLVAHRRREAAEAGIDVAFERLRWVDQTMSRFSGRSDIGRVNRLASREPVEVDPATATVIADALWWAERSEGQFDPALARVMDVWDPIHRTRPPALAEYARFAGRRLHRGVTVDRWRGRSVVRLDDPDLGIDLGGIAKGYAVDCAVEALTAAGLTDFVVDAGGDLRGIGRSADGDRWRVGVRSPVDPTRLLTELELAPAGEAIATSGDYLQGFDFDGRRYHHILDAAGAMPRLASTHSLTIRAATCLEADAVATAAFGRAPGDGASFVARIGRTATVAEIG